MLDRPAQFADPVAEGGIPQFLLFAVGFLCQAGLLPGGNVRLPEWRAFGAIGRVHRFLLCRGTSGEILHKVRW